MNDEEKIGAVINDVIKSYPEQVGNSEPARANTKILNGMVMKATEGSADPKVVEKILREKLSK